MHFLSPSVLWGPDGRGSLTRSTQSTNTLSSLATGDVRAGEGEEVCRGAWRPPGSPRTPACGDTAAHITTPTAPTPIRAPRFVRVLTTAPSLGSHSFLARDKPIHWTVKTHSRIKSRGVQERPCGGQEVKSGMTGDASLLLSVRFGVTGDGSAYYHDLAKTRSFSQNMCIAGQ